MSSEKEQYLEFHRKFCDEMIAVTIKKNADYTGKSDDPFANFSNVKSCGGATPEQGFLIRMNDKSMRISSFVEKGELLVKDETVKDTLLDLANYCILMAGYLRSKKQKEIISDPRLITETLSEGHAPYVSICRGYVDAKTFNAAFEAEGWDDNENHGMEIKHETWVHTEKGGWEKYNIQPMHDDFVPIAVTVMYW